MRRIIDMRTWLVIRLILSIASWLDGGNVDARDVDATWKAVVTLLAPRSTCLATDKGCYRHETDDE